MNKSLTKKSVILIAVLLSSIYSYGQCNSIIFFDAGEIEATSDCVGGTATYKLTITATISFGGTSSVCIIYEEGGVEKQICLNANVNLNEEITFTADCGSFFTVAAFPEQNGGGGSPCFNCGSENAEISCIEDLLNPLPVELSLFDARFVREKKSVLVEWNTVTEINNLGFEVERSTDGRDWKTLDFIPGGGTTTEANQYNYEDGQPMFGYNYYRLKQIDFDGDFKYSHIVSVLIPLEKGELLKVFPNPSTGTFEVSLYNPNKEKAFIKLLDNTGSQIWSEHFNGSEAEVYWEKSFDLPQREVYFLVTQVGNLTEARKVVIIDRN